MNIYASRKSSVLNVEFCIIYISVLYANVGPVSVLSFQIRNLCSVAAADGLDPCIHSAIATGTAYSTKYASVHEDGTARARKSTRLGCTRELITNQSETPDELPCS